MNNPRSKRELLGLVEAKLYANSKVTRNWLRSIHSKFAEHCEHRMRVSGKGFSEVLWYELKGKPICPSCKINTPRYLGSWVQGFSAFCSSKCAGADTIVKEKRKLTNLRVYGETSPTKVKAIREKQAATMLDRYGVAYGGQCPAMRERANKTLLERFPKGRKDAKYLNAIRATYLKKYGVDHPMKNREYFENQQKAGFKIREATFDGKTFRVRGFEVEAIRWLVENANVPVDAIHTTAAEGVPSIAYYDKELKRERTYHPDILVRLNGKEYVFEVKSTYTCGLHKRKSGHVSGNFQRIKTTAQATIDAGYPFKLLIVSRHKRKKKVVLINNLIAKSKKEVAREYKRKTGDLCSKT